MKVFTTVQIAKICNVYQTTVINWIESDKLRAFKTPGGHRRVREDDLKSFLRQYNFPVDDNKFNLNWNIFIFDDDDQVLEVIRRLFRAEPYIQTRTFQNAIDGLLAVGRDIPDLIIINVLLPEIDGIELVSKLKSNQETAEIHVLATAGSSDESLLRKIKSAGCEAFIAKPIDLVMLKRKVQELLNLKMDESA